MYVRWKKRKLSQKSLDRRRGYLSEEQWPLFEFSEHTLYAVLVESVRIDGKPRQRIVCILGYIGDKARAWGRYDFWNDVRPRLDGADLDRDTYSRVVAKLRETVPEPTDEELNAESEEDRRLLDRLEKRERLMDRLGEVLRGGTRQ